MRTKIGNDIILLNLLTSMLIIVVVFFPSNIVRIILGFPFVILFPGYALGLALFPRREKINNIERLVLSFGLSIAVTAFILLILNSTRWGVRQESIISSLASFIFFMSIIAWFRRKGLPKAERVDINLRIVLPRWETSVFDKVLSVILVTVMLCAFFIMGYVITTPKTGQQFTEFYILGQETNNGDYPEQLVVGEEGKVVMGIINHEYHTVSYRVKITINGLTNNEIGPILLKNNEKREEIVVFTPHELGDNQKLELSLYRENDTIPYSEPLRLWIDVRE